MNDISYFDRNSFLSDMAGKTVWEMANAKDNSDKLHRLKKAVPKAMAELTPRQQELIELYYGKKSTMKDIASELGVNESTVSRTLARARKGCANT